MSFIATISVMVMAQGFTAEQVQSILNGVRSSGLILVHKLPFVPTGHGISFSFISFAISLQLLPSSFFAFITSRDRS